MDTEHSTKPGSVAASPLFLARLGGVLYLVIIVGGLFGPFAVAPTGMMLGGASLPAVARILASPELYALGGIVQLIVYACDAGVALIFYELLRPVNRGLALLACFFRLVFVAVAASNMIVHFAPLVLMRGAADSPGMEPAQVEALALASIRLRTAGFDVALVFFGFHCVIAGYLIFKSTFLPRILGVALATGGAGYVANIFISVIPSPTRGYIFPYALFPAGLAEVTLTGWLILRGLNVAKWYEQGSASLLEKTAR
jgi:hypothetical protein